MPASVAPSPSRRFSPVGVLALTVLVFGGVVAAVTWRQREDLKEQLLQREAERLEALSAMQLNIFATDMGADPADVPGALRIAVLKAIRYGGVLGVRVFDVRGEPNGSDGIVGEFTAPAAGALTRAVSGDSQVHLHTRWPDPDLVFAENVSERTQLIEAWVPLRRRSDAPVLGAAQFWLRGDGERAELSRHDRRLWMTAGLAWVVGSCVIAGAMLWAFRRLDAVNRQLRTRSEDLQRANRELVLAAKTSALGAVTAHLMHELKTPIAGLEVIVAGQGEGGRTDGGGELAAASALTRRLRTMVNDVVGVLRDEQNGANFELTGAEIAEVLTDKVAAEAKAKGVEFRASGPDGLSIEGRRANLATLVLRNLVQNAIEATPGGGSVRVSGREGPEGGAEFLVEDTGSGLSPAVRARLFQPCTSSKPGGSGLGLALSQQLAHQAGGRLELVRSDERGTSFRLVLGAEA